MQKNIPKVIQITHDWVRKTPPCVPKSYLNAGRFECLGETEPTFSQSQFLSPTNCPVVKWNWLKSVLSLQNDTPNFEPYKIWCYLEYFSYCIFFTTMLFQKSSQMVHHIWWYVKLCQQTVEREGVFLFCFVFSLLMASLCFLSTLILAQ